QSRANPDVHVAAFLGERLGLHTYYEEAQQWFEHGEMIQAQGNAILSRFPAINYHKEVIHPEGQGASEFESEARIYLEAEMDIDGSVVRVATTHMPYVDRFEPTPFRQNTDRALLEAVGHPQERYV